MKTKYISILITLASTSISSATTTLSLSLDNISGTTTSLGSTTTVNSITDTNLGNVAWTDGVFSGVVNISADFMTSNAARNVQRAATGQVGINDQLINGNEGFLTVQNLMVTAVSGDTFTVDGFTSISLEFGAGTGGFDINGGSPVDNTGDLNTTGDYATGALAASISVDAASSSNLSITGFDIQLTGVPEPSSTLLLGLGSFALMARRKRA